MAAAGARVVVVSSGDPGVFAMASAVFEALEAGPPAWRALDIRVLPGVTAMLAAAARAARRSGHDFCAINLSDNLKPWEVIERRLRLAVEADFAIALYNPRSASRPEGFARALDLLRATCEPARLMIFARAVSTPEEALASSRSPRRRPRWPTCAPSSSSARRPRGSSPATARPSSTRRGASRHERSTRAPPRRHAPRPRGERGAVDHHDRQPQRPRRRDLGEGPPPPAFFDTTSPMPCASISAPVGLRVERPPVHDHVRVGEGQGLRRRIDQPQEVEVLRMRRELREVLPPDGEHHPLAWPVERRDGACHVGHPRPAVAGTGSHAGRVRAISGTPAAAQACHRVPAHLRGEGVRRVDHMRDALGPQVGASPSAPPNPRSAAAAAGGAGVPPGPRRTRRRRSRAPAPRARSAVASVVPPRIRSFGHG
jgi:precorrin-3B C17-methyltransferase